MLFGLIMLLFELIFIVVIWTFTFLFKWWPNLKSITTSHLGFVVIFCDNCRHLILYPL